MSYVLESLLDYVRECEARDGARWSREIQKMYYRYIVGYRRTLASGGTSCFVQFLVR
jgi:hypothetical protein